MMKLEPQLSSLSKNTGNSNSGDGAASPADSDGMTSGSAPLLVLPAPNPYIPTEFTILYNVNEFDDQTLEESSPSGSSAMLAVTSS